MKKKGVAKLKKILEKDIQKAIIEVLELKKWLVVKVNNVGIKKENGSFIPPRQRGISDLIACSPRGRFYAIEVKRPGGKLTEDQDRFLKDVFLHEGGFLVAYSVDDVIKLTERCDSIRG